MHHPVRPQPESLGRAQQRPRRRRASRLIAISIGLLASLVTAEFAIRWVAPQESIYHGHGMFAADPDLRFRLRPGHDEHELQINEQGLRDVSRPVAKPAGVTRVLVLGDSFAFGPKLPLEEAFPRQLADKLGPGFDVVNSGTPGYSTTQEATWLSKFGLQYEPDVVVLAFFVGNDLIENGDPPDVEVWHGEVVPVEAVSLGQRLRRVAYASHVFRLLDSIGHGHIGTNLPGQREAFYLDIEVKRLSVCARRPEPNGVIERGWQVARDEIARIRDLIAPRPVVVLAIPDEFQVDGELLAKVLEHGGLDGADFDLDAPQRRLRAICAELRLEMVDPWQRLARVRANGRQVYLPLDSHWNARGHSIAAEWLMRSRTISWLQQRVARGPR